MASHKHDHTAELRAMLRDRGLRATGARLAVLNVLHERRAPMTHEEIMVILDEGFTDKATVWRILSDLSDEGILRRMDLGDRVWRYELLDACRAVEDDHAHFLCEQCGTVECLPPLRVTDAKGDMPPVLEGADFRMRFTGRCGTCAAL
jgi:Fur family transcriptional regulator, ferric uptake regulator